MQDSLHNVLTGLDYALLPALISNSTRAVLAMTATFAHAQRRRTAALRALRAFTRRRNDHDDDDLPT